MNKSCILAVGPLHLAKRNIIIRTQFVSKCCSCLVSCLQVVPGALAPVDVAVANILVGQLVRPSMVAALCANLQPGGLLCLSGIRPDEVPSLKKAYEGYVLVL